MAWLAWRAVGLSLLREALIDARGIGGAFVHGSRPPGWGTLNRHRGTAMAPGD
jgi:hypothetical protein